MVDAASPAQDAKHGSVSPHAKGGERKHGPSKDHDAHRSKDRDSHRSKDRSSGKEQPKEKDKEHGKERDGKRRRESSREHGEKRGAVKERDSKRSRHSRSRSRERAGKRDEAPTAGPRGGDREPNREPERSRPRAHSSERARDGDTRIAERASSKDRASSHRPEEAAATNGHAAAPGPAPAAPPEGAAVPLPPPPELAKKAEVRADDATSSALWFQKSTSEDTQCFCKHLRTLPRTPVLQQTLGDPNSSAVPSCSWQAACLSAQKEVPPFESHDAFDEACHCATADTIESGCSEPMAPTKSCQAAEACAASACSSAQSGTATATGCDLCLLFGKQNYFL